MVVSKSQFGIHVRQFFFRTCNLQFRTGLRHPLHLKWTLKKIPVFISRLRHKAEWYKYMKQPSDSLVANVFGIHFFIIFHPSIVFVSGVDSTGHPTIAAAGCSSSIGSVKIHFHGGARWMDTLILTDLVSRTCSQHNICPNPTSPLQLSLETSKWFVRTTSPFLFLLCCCFCWHRIITLMGL